MGTNHDDELPEGLRMTDLGPLPDDWRVLKLGDIADSVTGGGTPSTARPDYWDGPIQWTTSRRISGTHLGSGERGITQKGLEESSTHLIPRGNLLVGTRVGVGKVAVNDVDMAISQDLTGVFVNRGKYSVDFLAYEMSSPRIQEEFEHCARGTTIKGIPRDDLVKVSLAIPPLPEQKAIARVLSAIQKAIEAQDKIIVAARELKKSLMHHLFIYGPVPVSEAEKVSLKETEIGPVPEHWEVVRLESIVINEKGSIKMGPFGSQLRKSELSHSGAKVYGQENLIRRDFSLGNRFVNGAKYESLKTFEIKPLDVLVTMMGTVGQSAVFPENTSRGIIDSHLIRIRVKREEIEPIFLKTLFETDSVKQEIEAHGHGVIMKGLNTTIIRNLLIPLPSLREQQKIVQILSTVDSKIEIEENLKTSLQALFKTMLHQLMTGKVRVRDLEVPAL